MYPKNDTCQIKDLHLLYDRHFPEKKLFFVDVGAGDGFAFSNTWTLQQVGWHGLFIEPIPEKAALCRLYDHCTVIEGCVGAEDGDCTLYLGACPTIDEETCQRSPWGFQYDRDYKMERHVYKLDSILHVHPTPAVLNIDVEGAELHVLAGFAWDRWLIKMIIIESHRGTLGKDFHTKAIDEWFAKTTYERIYADGLNDIWMLP